MNFSKGKDVTVVLCCRNDRMWLCL